MNIFCFQLHLSVHKSLGVYTANECFLGGWNSKKTRQSFGGLLYCN